MKSADRISPIGLFFWIIVWPAVAWVLIRLAVLPLYATGGLLDGYFATIVACFVFRFTVPLTGVKPTNIIVIGKGNDEKEDSDKA